MSNDTGSSLESEQDTKLANEPETQDMQAKAHLDISSVLDDLSYLDSIVSTAAGHSRTAASLFDRFNHDDLDAEALLVLLLKARAFCLHAFMHANEALSVLSGETETADENDGPEADK